jgi:UDP-N-acetylmuramoylalanine--D-glutamate ligase
VGADLDEASRAVTSFQSLPHRLQVLGKSSGVTFINDSISSTPVATSAALETLCDQGLILILGGLDRGIDWSPYVSDFLRWLPRVVIGIPGNGPDIMSCLEAAGVSPPGGFHQVKDLHEAVDLAKSLAREGEVVALSPGAPSFPQFTDFQARGQAFAHLCGLESVFS